MTEYQVLLPNCNLIDEIRRGGRINDDDKEREEEALKGEHIRNERHDLVTVMVIGLLGRLTDLLTRRLLVLFYRLSGSYFEGR